MAEESSTIGIDQTEETIAMYEPAKRDYDDQKDHTETGNDTDGTRELSDEEQFRAKDFRTVDDIMKVIDEKKGESPEEGKDEPAEKQEKQEVQEQKNSDAEQSLSSEDTENNAPAEGEEGTQESKSESDKEGNETASTEIELSNEEDLTVDVDGHEYSVSDIVDEWQNNRDWQKANTERAQEIAEDRKAIDAFRSEEVMALLKDKDFLDAVDDWHDGKDNPLRKVAEHLEQSTQAESVQQVSTESTELARERTELEVDREILDLQSVDESLRNEAEMERLLTFAVDNDMTLYNAHQYKKAEDMERELGTVQDELLNRNKELSELKKTSGKPIPSAPIRGQGSKGESLPPNSQGWKGAEDRVLSKLGL